VEDEPAGKGQHERRRRWDEKHLGARLVAKGGHWRTKKGNNVMMISTHGGGTSRILRWFIIFRA
jgi:hypothetical protein